MTYPSPSMWNELSKIHYFMDLWHSFRTEAVEGQGCYFQPNQSVISQMSVSHECTDTVFMTKKCIFDGLISVYFRAYRVGTRLFFLADGCRQEGGRGQKS
jgi:hypothetical protein